MGLVVVGLVAWQVVASTQRAALAWEVENRPAVIGTPMAGGVDMSFVEPTPMPKSSGPQARLFLPRDYHSFGIISAAGPPVEHAFRVLNSGEADLDITGLSTSCGCTTAYLSANRIPPGESAELVVRYDPSVHPQPGQYTREVYIYSTDPIQHKAVVTIEATTR